MKSVQSKITIAIILSTAFVLMFTSIFIYVLINKSTINAVEKTLEEAVTMAASSVENDIEIYREVLQEIAANQIMQEPGDAKYRYLRERADIHGYFDALHIDANGIDLLSGKDVSREPFFMEARHEFYISDPLPDGNGGMFVYMAEPIPDGTVLCFKVDQEFLQHVVEDVVVGESDNADVYVLDKNGVTIASLEYELVLNAENLVADMAAGVADKGDYELAAIEKKMITGATGLEHYKDGNGVEYVHAYAPIKGSDGWSIALVVDQAEFTRYAHSACLVMMGFCVLMIALATWLANRAGKKIAEPIKLCSDRLLSLSKGDLKSPVPVVHSGDETQLLSESVHTLVEEFNDIIDEVDTILTSIAEGDLTRVESHVAYPGDFNTLKVSLGKICVKMNGTLHRIVNASSKVHAEAEQVADGAQQLAQGATEQASSVEEISATMEEVSGHVTATAENAQTANMKFAVSMEKLDQCDGRMTALVSAMEDINKQSFEISKIIKVIEDIAFQTNLLALNAAVEAARAGDAGKGFSVVADEVRTLAGKSSEASKSTAELIESSVTSVNRGMKILNDTVAALREVVEASEESAEIVNNISEDAHKQAVAVAQIREAIDQIASVVSLTSATSEESAATSQELAQQVQVLADLVNEFKLEK